MNKLKVNKTSLGAALAIAAAGMLSGCASSSDTKTASASSSQTDLVHCYGVNTCGGHNDCKTAENACATRHVGVAVMVAAALPGPRTAVLIAAYIVTSAVITIPYLRWQRARPGLYG